jgi:hypothetical protein
MRQLRIGHVSEIKIIETIRGKDGKRYPVGQPLPLAWGWEVVTLLHELVHDQRMSERQAQRELLARGYRRSTGSIHNDLERPMPGCARCQEAGGG